MSGQQDGESSQYLINVAALAGFVVNLTQLARWHRAGLLPIPHKQYLGRPQGTRSIYPAGTAKQLVRLCEIHLGTKRLPDIAWQLWWEGYPVAEETVRPFVDSVAEIWDRRLSRFRGSPDEGLSEEALEFVDKSRTLRIPKSALRRVRKRISARFFPTFMQVLLEIVVDRFQEFGPRLTTEDPDQRQLILRSLGFDQLPGEWSMTADQWKSLGRAVATNPFRELLTSSSDRDLRQARDEVRTFALVFSTAAAKTPLARVLANVGGQDAANALLVWRLLRAMGLGGNIDVVVEAAALARERLDGNRPKVAR